ncbi:MAG: FG-GAP-like repeat-containing protein [Chthoniobacterales bacterium]
MKKTSASRSAFVSPPVLITFCAIGALLALIAFALYPGATARGAQVSQQNQQGGQARALASEKARLTGTPLGAQTTFQVKITTGERVAWVDRTCDGGYILVAERGYVVKLRADGSVEWDRILDGGSYSLFPQTIKQTSDGGFIIVGELSGGTMKTHLVKLDFAGNPLWARVLPGTGDSGSQGRSGVDEMSDGGFIINASLQQTGHAQEAPLLLRTDRFGVLQWAQYYNDNRYGVDTFARFNDVKVAHDGNLIACGNTALDGLGQRETLLVKTDPTGNILWSHTYDLPNYDVAFGLDTAANGDFLIVGTKKIIEGGGPFVLRTDPLGNVLWYKTFRTLAQFGSIRETPTGDVVVGGTRVDSVNWDASLLKLNSSGDFQWCKSYSTAPSLQDYGAAVVPALDGGYLLAGWTGSSGDSGGAQPYYDLYAVKTDAAGNSGCNERDFSPILGTDLPPLLNVQLNAFALLQQAALPIQIAAANSPETVLCRQVALLPAGCPPNYPNKSLPLSGNTKVTPNMPPASTTSINVSTSTNFKGLLEGDPATGTVRVTNAHPAGTYAVTVTFGGAVVLPPATFMLTVTTPPPCNPVDPIAFTPKTDYAAGTNPRAVAIGDFNRDGVQDLVVAIRATPPLTQGKVSVLLGKKPVLLGKPTFVTPAPTFDVGNTPNSVAVGDFNGDGIQDIATANSGSDNVSILLNTTPALSGTLTFTAAGPYPVGDTGALPRSIVVGDFNGDRKQDLAVINENGHSVSVLLGDGAGFFSPASNSPFEFGNGLFPYWVAVGDFNGDGKPDLAVTIRTPDSRVLVLLNTSTSVGNQVTFGSPISFVFPPGEDDPLSIAVGKFDPDGKQDIVTANQVSNDVSVGIGSGDGSFFRVPAPGVGSESHPQSVAVGDFNHDAKQDLVVANDANNVSVDRGLGTGGFLGTANFPIGAGLNPKSVAVGDFNGDGKQDLAVANFGSNDVSIFLGKCPCGATFSENFDVPLNLPPNLPPGWVAANVPAGGSLWATSNIVPDTMPNDAIVYGPATVSDKRLDTPGILISSASTRLCFRHAYSLESGYDGGVLEVSSPNVNGGAFTDITDPALGSSFISGGYNATISGNYRSPIADRRAWSGSSSGYICTVVNLGPNVNGQTIKLRFRMGTDVNEDSYGWRIDTIQVSTSSACCCGEPTGVVGPGPGGGLLNLSTRMLVGTGDNVGIGGFIVAGSDPKPVLLRAIGPSLSQFGVPNALADPVLELHGPGAFATITNNNWRDTQAAEIQATGIPPTNDFESAIVATLDPGAYSAVVRGNSNTSGVALIEVYDLDQEAVSNLANISTRAFVNTGDNIVIAGFTLSTSDGGEGRVVARGIGPSLAAVGVSNALADPTLELRDGNGTLLITNNDWQDDPAQAAELTAAGLAPTNNLESAVAMTLPPGAYTALLRGLNNGTGVGLIEVYDRGAP